MKLSRQKYRQIAQYIATEKKGHFFLVNSFFPQNRYVLPASLMPVFNMFKIAREIADISETPLIKDLIQLKFLVPEDFNEKKRLAHFRNLKRKQESVATLYVIPTLKCNLRCKYCFIYQGGTDQPKTISWPLLKKAVNYFFDQYKKGYQKKQINIVFYGGEPLLELGLIKKTIKFVGQKKDRIGLTAKISFILITNGTLIGQKAAKMLKEYGVKIGISFDGMPETTDKMRVFRAGGETPASSAIMKGIEVLKRAGLSPQLAITLFSHNLTAFKENLSWLRSKLDIKDFDISFYHPPSKSNGGRKMPIKYSINFLKSAIRLFNDLGSTFAKYELYKDQFHKFEPILFDCGATRGQIVVHPDGCIGNCVATLKSKKDFIKMDDLPKNLREHPVWRSDAESGPLYREECYLKCPYFSMCSGGCIYDSEAIFGSEKANNPTFCNLTKASFEILAEECIDQYLQTALPVV